MESMCCYRRGTQAMNSIWYKLKQSLSIKLFGIVPVITLLCFYNLILIWCWWRIVAATRGMSVLTGFRIQKGFAGMFKAFTFLCIESWCVDSQNVFSYWASVLKFTWWGRGRREIKFGATKNKRQGKWSKDILGLIFYFISPNEGCLIPL